jgi:hypothetical protein
LRVIAPRFHQVDLPRWQSCWSSIHFSINSLLIICHVYQGITNEICADFHNHDPYSRASPRRIDHFHCKPSIFTWIDHDSVVSVLHSYTSQLNPSHLPLSSIMIAFHVCHRLHMIVCGSGGGTIHLFSIHCLINGRNIENILLWANSRSGIHGIENFDGWSIVEDYLPIPFFMQVIWEGTRCPDREWGNMVVDRKSASSGLFCHELIPHPLHSMQAKTTTFKQLRSDRIRIQYSFQESRNRRVSSSPHLRNTRIPQRNGKSHLNIAFQQIFLSFLAVKLHGIYWKSEDTFGSRTYSHWTIWRFLNKAFI